MVKPIALANAAATVVALGYILCRLAAVVAPGALFEVGQSWLHTVNLEPLRATRPMSMGTFVLGLVTSVTVAWLATGATAALYRRWAA